MEFRTANFANGFGRFFLSTKQNNKDKIMRRKQQQIKDKVELEEIIREATVCRLAIADGDAGLSRISTTPRTKGSLPISRKLMDVCPRCTPARGMILHV